MASGQSAVDSKSGVTLYDEGNLWAKSIAHVGVERIVILGLKSKPKSVKVKGEELVWSWETGVEAGGKVEGTASRLTIKNPRLGIIDAWEVIIE